MGGVSLEGQWKLLKKLFIPGGMRMGRMGLPAAGIAGTLIGAAAYNSNNMASAPVTTHQAEVSSQEGKNRTKK